MTMGSFTLQEKAKNVDYSELMGCPNAEYQFKLRTGDMLVFYYFPREDQPHSCILGTDVCIKLFGLWDYCFTQNCIYGDYRLLHASCPSLKGTKYSVTYWMSGWECHRNNECHTLFTNKLVSSFQEKMNRNPALSRKTENRRQGMYSIFCSIGLLLQVTLWIWCKFITIWKLSNFQGRFIGSTSHWTQH